jgi:trimeric autotransporter adhesin
MAITTGNFQDLVQLSQDTLYFLGPDFEVGNTADGSTVSHGFNNTAGDLVLAGAATGNATVWLPVNNGTLLEYINVSGGTTSNNLSAITFSNSNGVSFGLNGSVMTASINPDALAIGAIGAGTQTATSGTVNLVNSNNITFGMSGSSQITASYNFNISAGTTSNNLNAVTFSNSNNVSFGLNGSTVTASVTVASTQASVNFSAGTTSNNLSAITFSNSNGVSFGLNGSTMTASIATSLTNINVSAGTTSNNLSAITFSNSNGVSFGLNGSVITASAQAQVNFSAGTTSNNLGAITFSNSNGISFGLNGSTMTASVATSLTNINVSAGTTSNNLSAITFSNSNNVSFGLNGSTITASVTVASTQASVNFSAGTTSNNLSAITFSNSNGVSFGLNGSTMTASIATSLTNINVSAGTTSNNLSAITFSNSNGISFGLNGSTITAALGGIKSWSNGFPATALSGGQGTLFFEPIIVPYNITVTNLLWLASVTNHASNSSGGLSVSAALYTLNVSTLSLASSGSSNITWTSGAALSSNTGINYQQMTVNSWALTPGPYLFGWWVSTQNSASVSVYGVPQQPAISSGQVAAMSTLMLPGYSQATTNALPTSFGISNTASYIRTGATAAEMPYIIFQGT